MPETPIYKFEVQVLNSEGLTPDSIVRAPRIYKPQDLQAACHNTNIICTNQDPAPAVLAMVNFVLIEFFVLAHRTGLYNRQKSLWESLAKVASASVFQLKKGIFRRTVMPLFDLHFQDHRGRTFILGHLIDPTFRDEGDVSEKLIRKFLKRAEKVSGLTGLFFCSPEPFPQAVLDKVSKLAGGGDPVGRYESVLPEPWSAPLDLLELSSVAPTSDAPAQATYKVRLVHPDLTATRRIRAATVQHDNPP